MLFTAATVASLLAAPSASPLLRRQGGGSGLPHNATEVTRSATNETYTVVADTYNGTSLNTPVFESVPQYYNQTFNSTNEPYGGAHVIYGNPTKNGTNTTMAYAHQPAGGLLINSPTYTTKTNFDFQSLNLALNQGPSIPC